MAARPGSRALRESQNLAADPIQNHGERMFVALALVEPFRRENIRPLFDAAPLKLNPATEKTPAISRLLEANLFDLFHDVRRTDRRAPEGPARW